MYILGLLRQFESIHYRTNSSLSLEGSYVLQVQISFFSEQYNSFRMRYFQHNTISYLKFQGVKTRINVTHLMMSCNLDSIVYFDDILCCIMNDLGASKRYIPTCYIANLVLPSFCPTYRRSTFASIKSLERCCDVDVVAIIIGKRI